MGNYNFRKDLVASEESVDYVIEYLKDEGHTDISTNNDGKYDIKYTTKSGKVLTAEVKNDLMWDKTGNIAIEYCSRSKPSGICTTQATNWFYVLGKEIYVAHPEWIRKYLIQHWDMYKRTTGGDDRTSLLALLPLHEFKDLFFKVRG